MKKCYDSLLRAFETAVDVFGAETGKTEHQYMRVLHSG